MDFLKITCEPVQNRSKPMVTWPVAAQVVFWNLSNLCRYSLKVRAYAGCSLICEPVQPIWSSDAVNHPEDTQPCVETAI